MLEEGMLLQYLKDNKGFANLLDLGAASLEKDYLPFKWKNAFTADGKKLVGLGTDVGGLAMCYRTDLFAKAGLPTDRDEVGKLWPTWDDYIAPARSSRQAPDAGCTDAATSTCSLHHAERRQLVLRQERQVHRRHQPGRQEGLGPLQHMRRQGPDREAQAAAGRVERRLQERRVRDHACPPG